MIKLAAVPLVAHIPLAALARVLPATTIRMVEIGSLAALARSTKPGAFLMLLTASGRASQRRAICRPTPSTRRWVLLAFYGMIFIAAGLLRIAQWRISTTEMPRSATPWT